MTSGTFRSPTDARLNLEPEMRKSFGLALGMHALLLLFLTVGLNWKSQTPAGIEAEIWDRVPQIQSVAQADISQNVAADDKADIALKKKKEAKPPPKEEPKPSKKIDPKDLKKQRAEEDKLAKAKEDKVKADKARADAARKDALAQAKARDEQLARIRAAAGKEGAAGGRNGVVGDGVGGGGNAKPGYADKVRRKVLPLIVFNPSMVAGNPAVEVGVELAPDGTILSRKVLKPSADAAWDKAVLRALDEAQSLPKDEDGKVPKQIRLTFKPKD